ncbi:MAG: OsmC family protein [Candidatus Limnocylindrales bacterium]
MARKKATITAAGPGLRFVAGTASGHAVLFDNEEGDSAARPMEVLLAALGACSGMDVLSIMRKKHQPIGFYHVRVEGDQRDEHPRVYTDIRVVHEVEGAGIDVSALKRAIELSAGKYCSISAMLSSGVVSIHHWYVLRGATPGEDEVGEVITTGPHLEPGTALADSPQVAQSTAGA